jgi:N-acetylneuraminic acid mutarotase
MLTQATKSFTAGLLSPHIRVMKTKPTSEVPEIINKPGLIRDVRVAQLFLEGVAEAITEEKSTRKQQPMKTSALENQIGKRAWREMTVLTVIAVSLLFTSAAVAQMPKSPWKKAAPFPEPDEELYGVACNGKMYVIGGWKDGNARGANYEYDPATDKWTKKTFMPRPAHHSALASYNGKIYVSGGFIPPQNTNVPLGGAWQPIDDVWEYDPAADSWRLLAPMPTKRGAAVAAEVGGKIYVIGGATTVEGSNESWTLSSGAAAMNTPATVQQFFTFFGPARVLSTNEVYDPATNKWQTRKPMSVPRNHIFAGVVNKRIYVIGGRTGSAYIMTATNTNVVEEYDPATDTWSGPLQRMPTARSGGGYGTDGRRIYCAGGEVATSQLAGAFRAVEAYEPATNTWSILPSMPIPRHGVAGAMLGNEFHLVSGMMQTAGALTFMDPQLTTYTAVHDILDLKALPNTPGNATTNTAESSESGN